MTMVPVVLFLFIAAGAEKITPVQSVLGMLSDMKAKGEKMKAEEEKVMAEYAEWFDDRTKDLNFEITTEKNEIKELIALIDEKENKAAQLGDAIAALDAEIARLEGEKKDATSLREEQHAEFLVLEKDYSESVDALTRAIQVLSAQDYDRPTAMMMLQKMAQTTPGMPRVLEAFLQDKQQSSQDGAPAVAAYEFQSGGIVAVLEGLHKKFSTELSDLQTDESNKQHYYDLEMIHLSDVIASTTADRDAKAQLKAKTLAESSKAQGELAATKEELAADEKELADMTATFESKKATYKENQIVRKEEIEALTKAIEIVSSEDVAGSFKEHIYLTQEASRKVSLLQTQSSSRASRSAAQQRAAAFLKQRAGAISSKVLGKFAQELAANPFEKVITMIEDLLEKLKAEAAAEAEHKAWCDEQLKENKLKRNRLTAEVNKLIAEIEEVTATIDTLATEIEVLVKEQADLAKAMVEATKVREEEHAANTHAIDDAKAGQVAVKAALEVLREFYSSQSFLQKQVPAMEAYNGMQNAKGGPIGMLEVILTDFARLEAETTAEETAAQRAYDTFMEESKEAKRRKHKKEVADRLAKDQAEFEKNELKKDLAGTEQELGLANDYYSQLTPLCLTVHVSWEERVAKRQEELEALNQAYAILDQKSR